VRVCLDAQSGALEDYVRNTTRPGGELLDRVVALLTASSGKAIVALP